MITFIANPLLRTKTLIGDLIDESEYEPVVHFISVLVAWVTLHWDPAIVILICVVSVLL